MSRIPKTVITIVHARAAAPDGGFYCEACGWPVWTAALHHRLPLSAGGPNTPENLMLVHGGVDGGCHNLNEGSIHQNPARSYRLGHMLRRGEDPATAPAPLVARDLRQLRE